MPDSRPNILFLFADQLRPFELGCHGHPVVHTPNLDRLAASGIRFEHAITTNPLCSPARSSLLTGQYSRTCTGMLGCCGEPVDRRCCFPDTTLAERLAVAGYDTALVGKWHMATNPLLSGFERAWYPKVHHLNKGQDFFDGRGGRWVVDEFCPDYEVRTTREFLREEGEQPFFLFHNLSLPHMPYFDVPERYLGMYSPDDVVLRPNVEKDGELWHDERSLKIYWYDYLFYKENRPDCQALPEGYDVRTLTAHYYGLITAVDDQVGAILDTLEETGQMENTLVVFTADHGDNLGSHHLWNKHSPNDEAIRVPFFVSWPGTLAPKVATNHVASLADVAPTALSLAGLSPACATQGRDLSPILRGEADRIGKGEAYCENIGGEIIVRTPTHKYAAMTRLAESGPGRVVTDDAYLFHDLSDDPYEQRNLANSGEQADTAADLCDSLLAWDCATPWMDGSRGGTYGQGE